MYTFFVPALSLIATNQGGTLGVLEAESAAPGANEKPIDTLHYPNEGEDSKHESRPVDERGGTLLSKDGEERVCNGNGSRKVTLGGREGVSSSGRLEEEQGEEDQDFGPDSGLVGESVHAESLKGSEEDQNCGPSVVEREGKMNKEFVSEGFGRMMFLDNIVNVSDSAGDEQGENERRDVALMRPEVDVDGIQDSEQRESPRDTVDDDALAMGEELIDDGAEEENVNDGPGQEGPWSRGEICFLSTPVDAGGGGNRVKVGTQED
jgi:hypothetical protein